MAATIFSGSALPNEQLSLKLVGTIDLAGAEISAYDPASQRLFVTSGGELQIVDLSDPTAPSLITTIPISTLSATGGDVTNVAVKNGVVAVGVPDAVKTNPGKVVFVDAATGSVISSVTVGALPDMLTFTPDGNKLLVANEGEPLTDANGTLTDPVGSISIIDVSGGFAAPSVTTAGFSSFNNQKAALVAAGLRIDAGKTVAQGVEPEYIAVSPDGTKAFITLQENNAFAVLDLTTNAITSILPLGTKDFGNPLNAADFSDRDTPGSSNVGIIDIQPAPGVKGIYQPDAIAAFTSGGQTFFVTANEGDAYDPFGQTGRGDDIRVGNATLDATLVASIVNASATDEYVTEADIKNNDNLGRLNVSTFGDTDGDGDLDQLIAFGGRSFSIWDANGNIVFDSGSLIERATAALTPTLFNANNGATADFDTRSDDKAAEPEGITVGSIGGKTYAFVALERAGGGVMAFDITDPADVKFVQYARNPADISAEGIIFIDAASSPNGSNLVVVSNEVSGSVSFYEANETFTLQLLHFADGEAGLLAGSTAKNLAALVDAFDDDYANTLILAGGDNYIPGPFLAAGTDPSVQAVHGLGDNPGAADIAIHNRIGVEASTVGNHEFDLGTRGFSDAINDAAFPYLTANLDFSADSDISARYQETVGVGGLENVTALARKIVPSAVVTKGGEQIGLVGVTTQILEAISSTGRVEVKGFAGDGAETNDMALLAAQLQVVINDLLGQGVNKIVLMSHLQQIQFEKALAPLLTGVDIILAAGSNTRLGDADDEAVSFPGHAADFADTYPIVTAGADGKTTVIVNTDNEYTYLGRFVVQFDANGEILTNSIVANQSINGAYASTTENVAEAWDDFDGDLTDTAFAEGTKGEQVEDITEAVDAVILAKDGEIFGYTNVYLEGERAFVRSQETNLGNITADANLNSLTSALGAAAETTFVASLKNGGGIRAQIGSVDVVTGAKETTLANPDAGKPEGAVSRLDIENSLRFNNALMAFDTTAAGIKAILEVGVSASGNGRWPQIGGISFSFDPDLAVGSRITNIALIDENGQVVRTLVRNGVVDANAPATITIVTLNFIADDGDGYPIKANGENFRYLLNDGTLSAPVDEALDFENVAVVPANVLREQQAMQEYLQDRYATPATAFDIADTAQSGDLRIQNLNFRSDTVLDGAPIFGTTGDDPAVNGTTGDDRIFALAGNDMLNGGEGNDELDGAEGNDLLNGGEGNDQMAGGVGNDTYVVDQAGDVVTEAAGDSGDTVRTSMSYVLAASANIEFLETADAAGTTAINLTGNALAQTITGNAGANRLGSGADALADTLVGLGGDDTYAVNSAIDIIVEIAGGGAADVARSTVSFTLAADDDIEFLETFNAASNLVINLTGNNLAQTITGNAGANILSGLGGSDTLLGNAGSDRLNGGLGVDALTGGAGNDVFIFNTAPGTANRDTITDFSPNAAGNNDVIHLDNAVFAKLGAAGALNAGFFRVGAAAADANDYLVYNQATGILSYDADGNGAGAAVQIAFFSSAVKPTLALADFLVV